MDNHERDRIKTVDFSSFLIGKNCHFRLDLTQSPVRSTSHNDDEYDGDQCGDAGH